MASLAADLREELGTHKARSLRKKGKVPGVIYGHGEPTVHITLNLHEVELAVRHGERLLEIDLGGRKEHALIKEVQYDAMQTDILHVDLARVSLDERVKVTVPIILRGTPAGAAEGGVLSQATAQASVECHVTAIPEDIRVPIAHLKIGGVVKMRDLPLPEGAKLLDDPETIVCSVSVIAEEVVAPVAAVEGPAEPEIIGEKKREEEAVEAEEPAKTPKDKEKEGE